MENFIMMCKRSEEIVARDKTSLDITWIKDKSLADLDNLPDLDVLTLDIVDSLEAGLDSFRAITASLNVKEYCIRNMKSKSIYYYFRQQLISQS